MMTLFSQEQATKMMLESEKRESREEGKAEGLAEGETKAIIEMCREFGKSAADAIHLLCRKYGLTQEQAQEAVNKYWNA